VVITLLNPTGQRLSTIKVLFPASEAQVAISQGIQFGGSNQFLRCEPCKVIPAPPILQCYKCQALGHIARTCTRSAKCNHCSGPHEGLQCRLTRENISQYKCALCGVTGHGSSWPRCPIRQEAVTKIRDK
jgi:hypothetical protein